MVLLKLIWKIRLGWIVLYCIFRCCDMVRLVLYCVLMCFDMVKQVLIQLHHDIFRLVRMVLRYGWT